MKTILHTNGFNFKINDERVRIIIIELNHNLAQAYALILNSQASYNVVDVYSNTESAIKKLNVDRPNVILFGSLGLTGDSTINIRKIINKQAEANIIVYGSTHDETQALEIIKSGAIGLVEKAAKYNKLFDAIDEVMQGGTALTPSVSKALVFSIQKKHEVSSLLTNRQNQILELLATGLTYQWIAKKLILSKETVKSHISTIYNKLEVSNKSEALMKAREENLIA